MSTKKASRQLTGNVINNSGGFIKSWYVEDQNKTTKHCGITITQQYRWNQMTEPLYILLCKKIKGCARRTLRDLDR